MADSTLDCFECYQEMDVENVEEVSNRRRLDLACTECEHEDALAQVFYTDHKFTTLREIPEFVECDGMECEHYDCEQEVEYVAQEVGWPPKNICGEHAYNFMLTILEDGL